MATTPFKLRSQGSSFKDIGSSPVKKGKNRSGGGFKNHKLLDATKLGGIINNTATFRGGKDYDTTTSFTPQVKVGKNKKLQIGAKFSGKSKTGDDHPLHTLNPVDPFQPIRTQTSLTAKYDLSGKGGRRGLHSTFQGSLSGNVGSRDSYHKKAPNHGKIAYGGKVEAGGGTKNKNIKAFGKYGSNHSLSGGGTEVGVSGKYGILKGSAGYNLKTKKPQFKIGIDI